MALLFAAAVSAADVTVLTQRLENSHIFPPGVKVKVICDHQKIAVSTYKHPLGTMLDLRIDAILVGKELMATRLVTQPTIDVYFFEPENQNEYLLVSVSTHLVDRFNHGKTTRDDLLAELRIKSGRLAVHPYQALANQTYEEISAHLKASEGLLKEERAQLIADIEKLNQADSRVSQLKSVCLMIEDAARHNDDLGARAALAYAEELLQNARRPTSTRATQ